MIRVTFDLLPVGDESRSRTIGIMEIANIETRPDGTADYAVALRKTPPFAGALRAAWKRGRVTADDRALNGVLAGEDDELLTAMATGHHRTRRGVYDLLYRALVACGLAERNRSATRAWNEMAAVRDFAQSIMHGDAEHRAWLAEAAEAYARGQAVPVARQQEAA